MPPSINQLPAVAFSKNKISLVVHSDNFRLAAPVKAVNTITLTGAITAATTINISWQYGAATLTAVAVPDDSGLQIPAGDGGNAYATALAQAMAGNPFISRDFLITVDTSGSNPVIKLTAKKPGPGYNTSAYTGSGHALAVLTPGVTDLPLDNFMHYIQVLVKNDDGSDTIAYEANVSLDNADSGNTSIDLGEHILDSFLSPDIPAISGSFWQPCVNSIRKYYVRYAAFYGNPGFVRLVQRTTDRIALLGGYSKLALQRITDPATWLQNYLLPTSSLYKFQRWLETWPIDDFDVKTNQPAFLYFINNRTINETFKIRLDLVFTDASEQTVYLNGGVLNSYAKVAIAAGYKQLGLQAYTTDTKSVSKYQVRLVEAVSLESRSVVKTFTVNRDYEEYTRYFLYSDSAGNFKTLRTWGRSALSADITADKISLQVDPSRLPATGDYSNTNILSVWNDKVNTGFILARHKEALIEMRQADLCFRVIGSTLIPIVITSKKIEFPADGNFLNGDVIEYRLAYDEQLYTASSPALLLPQLSKPQNAINDL